MEIHVAYIDDAQSSIIASFGCEQDPEVWRYQGLISESDERWIAYTANFPSGEILQSAAD